MFSCLQVSVGNANLLSLNIKNAKLQTKQSARGINWEFLHLLWKVPYFTLRHGVDPQEDVFNYKN